jgi:hypothetical protein
VKEENVKHEYENNLIPVRETIFFNDFPQLDLGSVEIETPLRFYLALSHIFISSSSFTLREFVQVTTSVSVTSMTRDV